MYYNKKEAIAFQMIIMSFWPTLLFQHAKRSTTWVIMLGMTHGTSYIISSKALTWAFTISESF
jgi:hypothetical protein